MEEDVLQERVTGGLIGIAYGDAFGMPSEMWTPEQIREKLGYLSGFRDGHPDNGISAALVRGEVTDDTANSILVAEMLCENHGRVDAYDFIRRLKQWIDGAEKSSTVVGPSTRRAITLLDQGVPMQETGKTGTTNGAAMKILPVGFAAGIRRAKDMEELPGEALLEEVTALCMPTHYTSAAISGAAAIAAGGAAAVAGVRSLDGIFDYMARMADEGEHSGCPVSGPSVSARMRMGREYILSWRKMHGGPLQSKPEDEILAYIYRCIGTGLPTAESVPAAALLFWLSGGDPMLCARYAANIGGDTDTIGAIACGICGAYSGAGAFAPEDVELLERVNGLSFKKLADRMIRSCSR